MYFTGIQLLKSDRKLEYSEVIGKIIADLKAKGIINYYSGYRVKRVKASFKPIRITTYAREVILFNT